MTKKGREPKTLDFTPKIYIKNLRNVTKLCIYRNVTLHRNIGLPKPEQNIFN